MTKPPSRSNSKVEIIKASSIYESWMDGNSIKSSETRETATPLAQRKQRSNFKFDKRYADTVSITSSMDSPISLNDEKVFTPSSKIPRTPPFQQRAVTPNLHKPKKTQKKPIQTKATSPLIFEDDYSEFFDWIFNENENDINPAEIERMLFKTPKKYLNK